MGVPPILREKRMSWEVLTREITTQQWATCRSQQGECFTFVPDGLDLLGAVVLYQHLHSARHDEPDQERQSCPAPDDRELKARLALITCQAAGCAGCLHEPAGSRMQCRGCNA